MARAPGYDGVGATAAALRPHLLYFASADAPALQRELAWHAQALETSVAWREYWQRHVVPQGSAYLWLHGADGAARDLSLFAVPLVFTHAALARDELALNMMMTHAADHRIAYAFQGHGVLDDALGLHARPSDLTLFLLWSLGEYLGATGDLAFLDAPMPYHPVEADPGATVWDHLVAAVRYLVDRVGLGPHGLVRIGDGDWNDGIVLAAADHDLAVADGESVPNTQMAIAVLPRVAELVAPRDPALASELVAYVAALRAALPVAWTGSFFGRAFFGDGVLHHADRIDLEAQVWALVGDTFASPAERDALVAAVASELDDPSPAGATLVPGGEVWPAVSALLTWGYARSDPTRAWRHLLRNTLAAHADAYPDLWYGIWSGPDGLAGPGGARPGEAWYSPVTPMTDFPTMNNNQHALPLLAALRVAGVEATAAGLLVTPRVPERTLSLRTELVDLSERPDHVEGSYRPRGGADRVLEVAAPPGRVVVAASVAGVAVPVPASAARVSLPAPAGLTTTFAVDFAPAP
ncbi:MAG: hypothetical protein IT373_26485 [Polyangiaceae bacterium]|nr:hypothetical protein [Polyangiaceae bacterium]